MSTAPAEQNAWHPTHRWVADKIGFSIPGVSLIRTGRRIPSLDTMDLIEQVFGWPVCDQVAERHNYAERFNRVMEIRHAQEQEHREELKIVDA